ncbi:hypothetical protein FCM35_KLT18127 [Carex littledalei]|uniref:AT5G11810-like protein n=1 Tax=Carex littledalei TaxID=544730 RepID=A0A833R2X9_9POAL|nr:hypothetical protein FCM35_KLT18127 [Carex littledalei]
MADKPSRALVFYGDGLASLVSASQSNLHSFASLSSCGFLSLRSPPSQGQSTLSPPVFVSFWVGFLLRIIAETDSSELPSQLFSLLGFSGQNVLEASEYDLVFLHITSETSKTLKGKSAIDWLDQLVGAILEIATPGSAVSSRLHLSVVLSYETSSDRSRISLVKEMNSDLGLLRPRQSYTMKNGKPLDEIRHDHPMLVAQWQDGVTRRDLANAFTFEEFNKNGGNLAMLADQFLHEVAFKLWKAPKYGA